MDKQEKITVVKGKKEIIVLNYGERPLFDIGRGRFVPHNFQAETYVSGYTLIASTLVDMTENKLKYRFALKDDPKIVSSWKKSPTGALDEINRMLKNFRHKEGTNGQLMIGVTYEPVQARLRQVFNIKSSSIRSSSLKSINKASKAPSKEVALKEVVPKEVVPAPEPALPPLTTTTAITGPGYRGGRRVVPALEPNSTASSASGANMKRSRSITKSKRHSTNKRHHEMEEVVDERSMQPLAYTVPEPGATPVKSRQRGDSQQTDVDEIQFSSQQSLEIVGAELTSQDTLHRYVEKMLQQDGGPLKWRDGSRLSYKGSQRQDSLASTGTLANQRYDSYNSSRVDFSSMREDSLHSLKQDSTLIAIEAMSKLARSDTQTDSVVGGGAPVDESSQLSSLSTFQWPSSQHSVILTTVNSAGTASSQ